MRVAATSFGASEKTPPDALDCFRFDLMSPAKMRRLLVLFDVSSRKKKLSLGIAMLLISTAIGLRAQNDPDYARTPTARESNVPSRAEKEAEDRVSLSADRILDILQQEPGLLLQVKKMLVRKAFEQGRLLDPGDLTDETLFRLVREDENIRILATREIEDRSYIRAKPTKEEIEKEQDLAAQKGLSTIPIPQAVSAPAGGNRNQEDAYWDKHENDFQNYAAPATGTNSIQPATPNVPFAFPRDVGPQNPARAIERTSLPQDQDSFDGFGGGASGLSQIRPEELSQLLKVSATTGGGGGGDQLSGLGQARSEQDSPQFGSSFASSFGSSLRSSLGGSDGGGLSSLPLQIPGLGADTFDPITQTPRQATLENQRRPMPGLSDLNQDRPQIRHRPNPYANVPSLYDLYAQVSQRPAVLERFGMDVFRNGTGNPESLPMDLPAGPDYVLGPGDGLSIELWGGVTQRLRRVVDREGRVALPEVGTVQVSGRSLGDVQHLVQSVMRTQFRDVEADISLARIRSVRVYVVGDVASPGAYDISSLSTPLNALYAAGGPTSRGSLRHLRHYRGKQLVQEIDAYDLLLHGIHGELTGIQSGDTILVPPMGEQVTVQGMVRRPAIYEVAGEKNLAEVLELAGGVLPSGTLRHVDVDRLVAHEKRTMLRLDLPETNNQQAVNLELEKFEIQDGDQVKISPILPYSDQTVYVDGHVFHPGKYPYREGMKVSDVLHSYSDLLPEPSRRHAEIIRLQAPDYTPMVLAFNLADAMEGKDQNLVLKPFDTIRIFGRYDFEDPPVISVSGEVRDPGDHVTNGVTRLRDAVYLAGGVTPDAQLDDAQIFRHTSDGKLTVISVDLAKALSGDQLHDVLLESKDRVFIHRNLAKTDPAAVTIQGEVGRPGKYPLGDEMTAADLVRLAGGLKRSADSQAADLMRYLVQGGQKQMGEQRNINIAKALSGVPDQDVRLRDGDVLTIPQVAGWNDIGASVTLKGEIMRPGTYGIQEGEKLSSVLERSGGLRADAYPYGAILVRVQVRELEEKNRADLIRRVQNEGAALKLIPEIDTQQKIAKDAALAQWQTTLQKLENTPPAGRMVVHISNDVSRWANTPADLPLRAGDILVIPKQPNFVMVDGSVYNPTAITYRPGKSAEWYLRQAGGPTLMAQKKQVFVIRADGSVLGGPGGMWGGGALSSELRPGDMVMVPEKAFSGTDKWKTILETSQLVSAIGIGIQVARSF